MIIWIFSLNHLHWTLLWMKNLESKYFNNLITRILNHVLTTEEIRECCKDLKVIGKKDFKGLIKWRESLRIDLGYAKSRKDMEEEQKLIESQQSNTEETEDSIAEKVIKHLK